MNLERNQSNGIEHREVNCVPCDLYAAVKRGGRKRKIARKGKEKTIGTGHPALANSTSKLQIKRSGGGGGVKTVK